MSETAVDYSKPPTHSEKRCLRCGYELTWLNDGTLVHARRKDPQSDWAVCLEGQLEKSKRETQEARERAQEQAEYFAAAMAFIEDRGLTLDSATLVGYVYTVRQRSAK